MSAPPKFITKEGVRCLNPEYSVWQKSQKTQSVLPQAKNAATALPIVTSIQDQETNLPGTQVADTVKASIEMVQDEEVANQIGVAPEQIMANINRIFAKYEVPMGLLNKLMMLSDYQFVEMIVDDSGSMNSQSDAKFPTGQFMTRWQEVHSRILQMLEIMMYVPCPTIYLRFFNRQDVIELKRDNRENPEQFMQRACCSIGKCWQRTPSGTTPARERIAESLQRCQGQAMLRYFFCDGVPNGGALACREITQMLINRQNPQQNPFTFMSCTDVDEDTEWMKEAEEAAPYCAELDDYHSETSEVLHDQGNALPFNYGTYLIAQICGAFCPDDLDAFDESVPFAKRTIDNLLGYVTKIEEYKYYFDNMLAAQRSQSIDTQLDKLKHDYIPYWVSNFQYFAQASKSNDIPIVQQYRAAILQLKKSGC
jgi:hypothetical protein